MQRSLPIVTMLLVFALSCATSPASRPEPQSALTAFVAAMTNADTDALAASFADDATVFMPFDAVPRRLEGKAEIRSVFDRFFQQMRKPGSAPPYMTLEPRDVRTQLLGDVAVVTFHLGSLPEPGSTAPRSFSRRTIVVRWNGERWLVEHLHASNLTVKP
jgi:uncharacterized protein (TIGR02246 family)